MHHRSSAFAWQHFFWVTSSLELNALAKLVANYSIALDDGSEISKAQLATALTNTGQLEEALELIRGQNDSVDAPLQAYVAIRRGDPERALALLRSLESVPDLLWVQFVHISALLLSGRSDEARQEAETRCNDAAREATKLDTGSTAVNMALILGRLDLAEELLKPLLAATPDFTSQALLGQLHLLQGDPEAGIAVLLDAIEVASPLDLSNWEDAFEPILRVVAEHSRSPFLPR